jgi:hypothetical protein
MQINRAAVFDGYVAILTWFREDETNKEPPS